MQTRRHHPSESDLLRGAAIGFVGGLIGTGAMAAFEALWTRHGASEAAPPERSRRLAHAGVGAGRYPQGEPRSHHRERSAGERAAGTLVRGATGEPPSRDAERTLGSVMHFAVGAAAGAAYGALMATPARPLASAGAGTAYGTAVWLLADEVALPLTGFADAPWRTPARRHVYALAAHLAYGLGLHAATRGLADVASRKPRRPA